MIPPNANCMIGKMNHQGNIESCGALRHRDYRVCPVGALAVYLFWRWHCSGESFPVFRKSEDWFTIRLFKRDNDHLRDGLSHHTAGSWLRKLFDSCGIKSTKVGHATRIRGAQTAEDKQVPELSVCIYSLPSSPYFTLNQHDANKFSDPPCWPLEPGFGVQLLFGRLASRLHASHG